MEEICGGERERYEEVGERGAWGYGVEIAQDCNQELVSRDGQSQR